MNLSLKPSLALLAAALIASTLLTSCDNPACVFGGDCSGTQGSGGVISGHDATVPVDHQWLSSSAPTVTGFFPSGAASTVSKDTPIVVLFNESMAGSTLSVTTVRLMEEMQITLPTPFLPPVLVGDGRVMVILPVQPLTLGASYRLEWGEDSVITDLSGTELAQATDRVIGRFTVATTNPTAGRVLAAFPLDNAANQSATSEYVVVFDRKINLQTINFDSFAVKVGGATPANNPLPLPLTLTETRVWRYRSLQSDGTATEFPTSTQVQLTLSPSGHKILASDMVAIPTTVIDYTTAPFGAPHSAEIVSTPTDAIGIQNLDGTNPLQVGLQLVSAQATDRLGIFLFGKSTVIPTPPAQQQTIALYRERTLSTIPSFDVALQTVTLGETELDIAGNGTPVKGRVADGSLSIAFVIKRGTATSAVRMLDVDSTASGVQAAVLDTTKPAFVGFGTSGTNTTTFRSDMRDLSVVGRASEQLRVVEVATSTANNGALAETVASDASGLFVAKPVVLGVVDPAQMPLPFTLTMYDRAMNQASAPVNGMFTQLGAVGPGAALPGNATIDIEVFDERTLAAISGAKVFVHQDSAGTFSFIDSNVTSASGTVTLSTPVGVETLVTVDAANYDLFTFHGAPNSRISIGLNRAGTVSAQIQGTLTTTSFDLPQFSRLVADSRSGEAAEPVIAVQSCSPNQTQGTFVCGFGPASVRPGFAGALSFVGIDPPLSSLSFTAPGFLRAYALQLPLPALNPAQSSNLSLSVNSLLDDAGVDQELRAIDGPVAVLDASSTTGIDLADLDQAPRVAIQALVPGLRSSVLAGFGAALDGQGTPNMAWAVRTAIPGVCDPIDGEYMGDVKGDLVLDGTIDPDLFLRCELRDNAGNRAGRRARFSAAPGVIAPMSVPVVSAPAIGANVTGPEYDVVFANVIPDGVGQDGLYRVTLTANSGRVWRLYRFDTTGATHSVHLPDIQSAGGTPLPNGNVSCSVSAWAWPTFDRTLFTFTDIEREQDLFSEAASFDFTQL